MPTEEDQLSQPAASAREPEPCMPCRGTGRLVSHLGGPAQRVACPWCKGGGVRLSGLDAQATWLGRAAGAPPDGGGGAGDAA